MTLQNRWLRAANLALIVVAAFAILTGVFQTFMRYRYETLGGTLWRVDQLTSERCRVGKSGVICAVPKSASTSTSMSTSTSTSLNIRVPVHPHFPGH
jgi:hypothetical protein